MATLHFQLPPGKYYIGDPLYVLDESWATITELTEHFENKEPLEFQGYTLWGHSTAFGEGTYTDQNSSEYSVESGVLAAIPIDLIEVPDGESEGTIIECNNGLKIEHVNGTFWFDNICIKTRDVDEDDNNGYDDPGAEEVTF
jgi:hypothetical protein